MTGKRSRTKGHSFEREIANKFKELGFSGARRQTEYHEDDAKGVDLQGTGRFKVQCKRLKGYAPINRINEIQDAKSGDIRVLITKADREPTMAVLELDDLIMLLKDVGEVHQ